MNKINLDKIGNRYDVMIPGIGSANIRLIKLEQILEALPKFPKDIKEAETYYKECQKIISTKKKTLGSITWVAVYREEFSLEDIFEKAMLDGNNTIILETIDERLEDNT